MQDRDSAKSDPLESCSRRRFLLAAGTMAGAVGLAGCSSVTNYEFSAKPVVLPDSVRSNMGYETLHSKPVVKEQSRTIGGVEVNVTVESHVTVYGAAEEAERGTASVPTIGVASTPKASVMGRSFNPLARLSLANLLTSSAGTKFLQQAGVNEVGHNRPKIHWDTQPRFFAEREGTCLDRDTKLESYAGILSGDPQSVVFVHLTRVDADSVVIPVAVHGHDIEDSGRAFVGPDSGYLSPDTFEQAIGVFGTATANLRFDFGNDGSFVSGNDA